MCVSVPSRITSIADGAMPMAQIDVAGQPRNCCLAYLPDAQVGDYVLVQNGFATELMDAESAAESLVVFAELGLTRPRPAVSAPRAALDPGVSSPGCT